MVTAADKAPVHTEDHETKKQVLGKRVTVRNIEAGHVEDTFWPTQRNKTLNFLGKEKTLSEKR